MRGAADPADILAALAQTQREKDEEYGASWRKFGPVVAALFPDGVKLITAGDFGRFALLLWVLSKLSRYAANFEEGHQDSIKDAAVYCAMLAAFDQEELPG